MIQPTKALVELAESRDRELDTLLSLEWQHAKIRIAAPLLAFGRLKTCTVEAISQAGGQLFSPSETLVSV